MSRLSCLLGFCLFVGGCGSRHADPIGGGTTTTSETAVQAIDTTPELATGVQQTSSAVSDAGQTTPAPGETFEVPDAASPGGKLRSLAAQRSDYLLMVGLPLANPAKWVTVTNVDDVSLEATGHGKRPLSEVKAFIVAYPNGQLVESDLCGLRLPDGLGGLSPSSEADRDSLRLSDLEYGNRMVRVTHGHSPSLPNDRYATTLTNLSKEKIKVKRFGGYGRQSKGVWVLSTVTHKFYSAEEFREWYGVQNDGWILPGQSVVDPNNYGGTPCLWAYYCESESAVHFITGAVLQ